MQSGSPRRSFLTLKSAAQQPSLYSTYRTKFFNDMKLSALLIIIFLSALSSVHKIYAGTYNLPNTKVLQLSSEITGVNYFLYISYPRNYNSKAKKYPVIYLLDADYSFALTHNIVAHFVDRKDMPPTVIVGIAYEGASQVKSDYQLNRTRDYTPTNTKPLKDHYNDDTQIVSGGGAKFLNFLSKELIPYIESNSRVSKKDRTLVGHSFGGLFASYALFSKPSLFQRYIIVSPSLWYDNKLILRLERNYASTHSSLKARVFFSIGNWENPKWRPMVDHMSQLIRNMKSRSYNELKIDSYVFPRETHNSVFPAALSRGLRVVFNKM